MSECWLPVPGYGGVYEVSDHGRVRSIDRRVQVKSSRPRIQRGRVLKQVSLHAGHRRVSLFDHRGSLQRCSVHRLVLLAFVGPCPEGMEGCHNDGDPTNNNLSNLRWDTRSANELDKLRHGTHNFASMTHCVNGHEFTPENTNLRHGRWRHCRACDRGRKRQYRRAKAVT